MSEPKELPQPLGLEWDQLEEEVGEFDDFEIGQACGLDPEVCESCQ